MMLAERVRIFFHYSWKIEKSYFIMYSTYTMPTSYYIILVMIEKVRIAESLRKLYFLGKHNRLSSR